MYCKKCGNPIEDSASFCGSCGERIITTEDANNRNSSVTSYSEPGFDNSFGHAATASNDSKTIAKGKTLRREKRFPISVIVLSAFSLAFDSLIVFGDAFYSAKSYPDTIIAVIFSAITLVCFILTPKSKAYFTIGAVWLLPISYVVSLYLYFYDATYYINMPFEIAFVSLVTLFALLYTAFVAVKKAKTPIIPILMLLIFVLKYVLSVIFTIMFRTGNMFTQNMKGERTYYPEEMASKFDIGSIMGIIISGLLGLLILIAFVIAAFSLLPKKEKKH